MFEPDSFFIYAIAACVVAGFVRGFAGFGGPAVFLLLMTQFFDAARMVILIMLIDIVASVWLTASSYRDANWQVVRPTVIGALLLLPVGIYVLTVLDPDVLKRVIAVAVVASTLLLLTGWRARRMASPLTFGVVGGVTGVVTGSTYILVHMIAFMLAMPMSAAQARASFIAISFGIAFPLIVMHLVLQNLDVSVLLTGFGLGLVYTAGAWAGDRVFRRMGEERYRRIVLWLLVVMALIVAIR